MKRIAFSAIAAAALLMAACAVVPAGPGYGPRGYGGESMLVPVLPPLVVLETEPYYAYRGYHYHYLDNRWFYSRSRRGPWAELPRDHYPKELRYKGRDRDRDRDHDRDDDDRRGRGRY